MSTHPDGQGHPSEHSPPNSTTKNYGYALTFAGERVHPTQRAEEQRCGHQRDADQRGGGSHGDRNRAWSDLSIVASAVSGHGAGNYIITTPAL